MATTTALDTGTPAVELVRRFRGLRALVIGDAMLDSYLEGSATRLCTEGPVPVVRKTAEERAPGGAANTAANLRALGADVALLGIVGRDLAGGLLRAALRERGIDDRLLVEDGAVGTHHKLRILADDQYVVRFDEGDTRRCSRAGHEQLLANVDEAFPRCDLVVISDYGYDAVSPALLARLRSLRTTRLPDPCVLLVDSKDLRRFRGAGATIVTPNHLEARLAVAGVGSRQSAVGSRGRKAEGKGGNGQRGHEDTMSWPHDPLPTPDPRLPTPDGELDLAELERVGRELLAMLDSEHAAITLAGHGALLLDRRGTARHLPARPVAYAHDIGAGDTFAAATALTLAAGGDCVAAARIGIEAAGLAVTRRRTAVVRHRELLQRVSLAGDEVAPGAGALAAWLERERLAGRTIVFTNGVFDLLHAGHVQFLRRARELGDLLVVGVNSDRSARRLKGERRPINGERDRLALVAALDAVDHAVLFDEDTPAETIRALRPHIHVKGGDYAGEPLPEAEAVLEVGGRVVILPLVDGLSTSTVIERVLTLASGLPDGSNATVEVAS